MGYGKKMSYGKKDKYSSMPDYAPNWYEGVKLPRKPEY